MSVDERRCTKCDDVKPLSEFSKAPNGLYGVKASCKQCDAARHRALHPEQPRKPLPRRRGPIDPASLKMCATCLEVRPHTDFHFSVRETATRNAVYRSECKPCGSKKARDWYKANPERANAQRRKNNLAAYGITPQEYADLLRKQGGVCAVCGQVETVTRAGRLDRMSVDHCHQTGAVRGLLCQACNRGIGMLGDDPVRLRKAIGYLLSHRRGEIHQGGK